MSFLLFLRGMVAVLAVFAIITYLVTQSVWTTFIQTLICAVLIQVGYFLTVLFLVWHDGRKKSGEANAPAEMQQSPLKEEKPAAEVSHLRGAPPSR